MAWPDGPLPLEVKMQTYAGTWADITSDVRATGAITIRRGQADETQGPEPGSISLNLNNKNGKYSPRNPSSPYYGLIGRNTPILVRVAGELAEDRYLETGYAEAWTYCPSHSAPDIVGDIDMRIDIVVESLDKRYTEWNWASLAAKYVVWSDGGDYMVDERSWAWWLGHDRTLTFMWSPDGTQDSRLSATSTVPVGLIDGVRKSLRVTLDVDNGEGGHTVTFFTAPTIDGPWTQLGDPVIGAGITSIHQSTAGIEVGTFDQAWELGIGLELARLYAYELRDGINGTVVACPDLRTLEAGTTSFTDSSGTPWDVISRLWYPGIITGVIDPSIRGVAEISEWPARWDTTGKDVWIPLTAQGILRRLEQNKRRLRSPISGSIAFAIQRPPVFTDSWGAYWPMEDGASAQHFASGLPEGAPLTYSGMKPDFASMGPLLGSDKIATLLPTTRLSGEVNPMLFDETDGMLWSVLCLLDFPPAPESLDPPWVDRTPILRVLQDPSGSTVHAWEVLYRTGGTLDIRAVDATGGELDSFGVSSVVVDYGSIALNVGLHQAPWSSNVTVLISITYLSDSGGTKSAFHAGSFSSLVLGRPVRVDVAPKGKLGELGIGQLGVSTGGFDPAAIDTYKRERAAERFARVCADVGIPARVLSADPDLYDTPQMGPQAIPSSFADTLADTRQADQALVYERRSQFGLSFRTRRSLYNQRVALTLDYAGAGEISQPLEPIDDDLNPANRVEVRRRSGSSAVFEDSTSRLGTADPPIGAGAYEQAVEVNLYDDSTLLHHAAWRVHLGTWDEPRFPRVHINMAALKAAGQDDKLKAARSLDVGDRIKLINLPAYAGAIGGVADLLVLGTEETFTYPTAWDLELNCVPAGPYTVGTWGPHADASRWDTDRSTVTAGLLLPGVSGSYADTYVEANITGDLDLRVDLTLADWTPPASYQLIARYGPVRSYRLRLDTDGSVTLVWSPDGTSGSELFRNSGAALPVADGDRLAVRATLDVDDGAGGHTATFFTGPTIDGPWTQLASTTRAGVTSIYGESEEQLQCPYGAPAGTFGVVHAAEVRDGIDGTIVANPRFDNQVTGTNFADSVGNWWFANGAAQIVSAPAATNRDAGLALPGTAGSYASTPDHASLNVIGDLDIRAEATLDSWQLYEPQVLAIRTTYTGMEASYVLFVFDGWLGLSWEATDGAHSEYATDYLPAPDNAHLAVRATLDVDDGAGGHTVTFFTGPTIDGPWTQLGDPVTGGTPTDILPGSGPLEVGGVAAGTSSLVAGTIHAAEIRAGIDGMIVADPRFNSQPTGATSFADSAGKLWTVHGAGQIVRTPYTGPMLVTNAATDAGLRYGWQDPGAGLRLSGATGSFASTPDHASLRISGDLDLRVDVTMSTWRPASAVDLIYRWSPSSHEGYRLRLNTDGTLTLAWSEDGTEATAKYRSNGAILPAADGERLAVRATLDADNGAGGHTVTFYTAPAIDGPWSQLGSANTRAGVTSIFAAETAMYVPASTAATGTIHAAEVRDGIDGTIVANPRFGAQTPGTTTFSDDVGRLWTIDGDTAITPGDEYDLRVGGPGVEQMTLHHVAGAVSPQALTVTRSVNGAAMTHLDGAKVSLWEPSYWGL